MLPDWTVVGFSGHRQIANEKATAESIRAALDDLAAKHGPIVAISSLANGSDALFLTEVSRRNIPFLLILPFPKSRFQKDFQPEEWQRVTPLMERASHIEEVSGADSDNEAYMETGVRVVDHADVLVAVWDGKQPKGFGGTGDVVAYCRALDKPLEWLNPLTGDIVVERFECLPQSGAAKDGSGKAYETIEKHFRNLDEGAALRAPKVRHLIQRVVLLHLIASAAGLVALSLDLNGLAGNAIAALEIVVLATAFILTAQRHRTHAEWMKSRIEAEICRSFMAIWPLRGRISRMPDVGIPGFERLTRNLWLMQKMDGTPPLPLETARDEYLQSRIQDQIGYFSRRCKEALRSYRTLKGLAMASTATAGLLAGSHFVLSLMNVKGSVATATELLSLIFPLVSAALFSLILTQEHSRRANRYQEMVVRLEAAALELKAVRTWNGLVRVATETEEQLLNEAIEWHSFRRFASEAH